ncbi:hypothetical protein D3C86_1778650 [compost metagenome]
MSVARASAKHQGEAAGKGDQARPEKGIEIIGALEHQQRQHGNGHADGQGDQKNAEDETDDAQRRQGHAGSSG